MAWDVQLLLKHTEVGGRPKDGVTISYFATFPLGRLVTLFLVYIKTDLKLMDREFPPSVNRTRSTTGNDLFVKSLWQPHSF